MEGGKGVGWGHGSHGRQKVKFLWSVQGRGEGGGRSVHDLFMRGSGIRNEEYEFKFGIALSAS